MTIADLRALAAYHREQQKIRQEIAERMIASVRERNLTEAAWHGAQALHLDLLADAFSTFCTLLKSHEE